MTSGRTTDARITPTVRVLHVLLADVDHEADHVNVTKDEIGIETEIKQIEIEKRNENGENVNQSEKEIGNGKGYVKTRIV